MTTTANALLTKTEPMTLQEFFTLAGVTDEFDWAKQLVIVPDPDDLSKEVYPHQPNDLNQALANERLGLYNEQSTGKTLPAQAYCLYQMGVGNRVVAIMPPILIEQFLRSFHATFPGFDKFFRLHVLDDAPKRRAELFATWRSDDSWPDLMLMSYQMFAKVPRARKNKEGEIIKPLDPDDYIVGVLKQAGYAVLVADEAHYLRGSTSDVHKAVAYFLGQYGDSACVLMTGTPIYNTMLDAYGMIALISPEKYASKKSFERTHCIYQEGEDGWSRLAGFKNKLLLTANLYAHARRITKAMVFSPKEPVIREIPVTLSRKHMELYKQLVRERFLELGDGEIIDALKAQALRQKCLQIVTCPQFFTNDRIDNKVIEMLDELIEDIGIYHQKVVLFANFQRTNEYLYAYYKRYNPALIYGGTGNNNREKDRFLQDDACRLACINPLSGGAGLNLHTVCSAAIFVEPTSVPGTFKQAMERLRVGHPAQKNIVSVDIIKALGTVAPKATRAMLDKERDMLSVTKDRQSLLGELLGEG